MLSIVVVALFSIIAALRFLISPPLSIDRVDLSGKVVPCSYIEQILVREYDQVRLQVAIITGSNSGVGKEAARILASWNSTVIIACRSLERVIPHKYRFVYFDPPEEWARMDLGFKH